MKKYTPEEIRELRAQAHIALIGGKLTLWQQLGAAFYLWLTRRYETR